MNFLMEIVPIIFFSKI